MIRCRLDVPQPSVSTLPSRRGGSDAPTLDSFYGCRNSKSASQSTHIGRLIRPNFLILTTDQHNPTCLGYAGHPLVRSPNIDTLAARGMVFDRAYVSNPLCTTSRATLFTGLTTRGPRVRNKGIPLSYDVPTMPEALRQAGYQTHYAGKPHLRTSLTPLGLPLDQVDPAEFPEARELWRTGRIKQLPTPYYGFEQVEFVNRHGHGSGGGEYVNWLEREHPDQAHLFHDRVPLEPPSPCRRVLHGLLQVGATLCAASNDVDVHANN